jgi:predicted dehydrogenase
VKPLTAKRSEAIDLMEIQKRNHLLGIVEFHKRYDESNLFVKKCLAEKQLGKLLYFTVDFSQRVSIPLEVFRGWVTRTNVFQYLGVHYVDLIYFMTGFRPVRLTATGTCGLLVSEGIDNYDSIHAKILWRNPNNEEDTFVSMINTNWVDPRSTSAMSDQKYKVVGTRGRIECDQKNRGIECVQEKFGVRHVNPYFSEFLPSPNGLMEFSGYGCRSISLFLHDVERIRRKELSPDRLEGIRPTFSEAIVSTSVLEAVNRSLENGSNWMDVDDLLE